MALKTYVLLEHTKPTANVYLRVNENERVRMDKRPSDYAYMQIGFTKNSDGINRVLRLKLNSNSIYQDEQIKAGILANERFTPAEKDAVKFTNGVLVTNVAIVQKFLDESPQNEEVYKSGVYCPDIVQPLYKSYDESVVIKSENQMFHKRLKAANKIAALSLEQAQELMIRLNGSFFEPPKTLEECQNSLVAFLDEANEAALDDIIRDEISNVEEVALLVGKAMLAEIISFDMVQDNVVKNTSDGRIIPLKQIPSSYSNEERERVFVEFLTSKDGSLVLDDIRNELAKKEKETPAKSSTGNGAKGRGGRRAGNKK